MAPFAKRLTSCPPGAGCVNHGSASRCTPQKSTIGHTKALAPVSRCNRGWPCAMAVARSDGTVTVVFSASWVVLQIREPMQRNLTEIARPQGQWRSADYPPLERPRYPGLDIWRGLACL